MSEIVCTDDAPCSYKCAVEKMREARRIAALLFEDTCLVHGMSSEELQELEDRYPWLNEQTVRK